MSIPKLLYLSWTGARDPRARRREKAVLPLARRAGSQREA